MNATGTSTAAMLCQSPRAYAAGIALRQLGEDCDPTELAKLMAATELRLRFLGESLAAGRPAVFEDHMRWSRAVHASRAGDPARVEGNLEAMAAELAERLPAGGADLAVEYVRLGQDAFAAAAVETITHLTDDLPLVDDARRYMVAILEARTDDAVALVEGLLERGHDVGEVLSSVLVPAQREIGRLWQIGDAGVADEHLASRTTERVLAWLHRHVRPRDDGRRRPRVIFAAGEGDAHDIGQRIVSSYFELAGWQSIVFGASMPVDSLVQAIEDYEADVVALSIQIGLHVRSTARLVGRIREKTDVPVILGGRMLEVVPDLWEVLGAHGGTADARDAVELASRLAG